MVCPKCGKGLPNEANFCYTCGSQVTQDVVSEGVAVKTPSKVIITTKKKKWIASLLCLFLGGVGAHRFYVGKVGTGVLYLFTLGLCGFGAVVDLIGILAGNFKDKLGQPLAE